MRRQQGGLPAIDGEVEPRLVPAYELGIDAREQAAIDERTVLLPLGELFRPSVGVIVSFDRSMP